MIAEFGLAALWLAAALAMLQLLAGALALTSRGEALAGVVRPVAVVQGVLCALAFAALILLFVQTDLSVKLVAMITSRPSPSVERTNRRSSPMSRGPMPSSGLILPSSTK